VGGTAIDFPAQLFDPFLFKVGYGKEICSLKEWWRPAINQPDTIILPGKGIAKDTATVLGQALHNSEHLAPGGAEQWCGFKGFVLFLSVGKKVDCSLPIKPVHQLPAGFQGVAGAKPMFPAASSTETACPKWRRGPAGAITFCHCYADAVHNQSIPCFD